MGRKKRLLEGGKDSLKSEPAAETTEKETVIGEIVGAVIDHKAADLSASCAKLNSMTITIDPAQPDLSVGLSDWDRDSFCRGLEAFGDHKGPDDCPFLADEQKSELWLKGFIQGLSNEGWMSAKYKKPITDCPYLEVSDKEFSCAEVWRDGWNAFHGAVVDAVAEAIAEAITEAADDLPTAEDIIKLAEGTTPETAVDPATNENGIPKPSTNGHTRAPFNSLIGAQWLQEIQDQNKVVQRAEAEYEAAKLFARGKKTAHEEAVSKLTKLISDQEEMQTAWNRPLPLFDATQIFKPGESSQANPDASQVDATPVAPIVDPAKTGPLSDEQVENAWRYASIDELNLPRKLAEKLREDAHVSNIGELEDLRATFKGLGGIKGIGPSKITIIEDAVVAWLSIQRDAKALAAAAGSKSQSQSQPTATVEATEGDSALVDAAGIVGIDAGELATATVAVVDVASFVPDVSFDDI